MVAFLLLKSGLVAAVTVTVPLPEPEEGENESQLLLLTLQFVLELMLNVLCSVISGNSKEVSDKVKYAVPADWVTLNFFVNSPPLTEIDAVRGYPKGFASAVIVIEPLYMPEAGVTVIHVSSVVTSQLIVA